MATAIELYAQAYDLDYRKGDWQTAEELYREIVERFPYSDEKEYAQVHLDRIDKLKADPGDVKLQPIRGHSGINGLSVVTFLLVLLLILAAGAGGYFGMQMYQLQKYQGLLLRGGLSEKAGDVESAHRAYKNASEILPDNSLSYRYLAELYLEHGQRDLATIEFERWRLVDPFDIALKGFEAKLQAGGMAPTGTPAE